jgi:hypothetical protein
MLFRAKYFTIIECVMPANAKANQKVTFNPQTDVQTIIGDQTVVIEAIETYTKQDITNSPLTTANPTAAAGDLTRATLLLRSGTFEQLSQMPLASLRRVIPDAANYAPSVWQLMQFRDLTRIDWTKSGIILVADAVTVTKFSFLFGVYYDYLKTS